MEDKKLSLIIGFAVVGSIFVGLSLFLSNQKKQAGSAEFRLARVDRESGTVSVLRSGYTEKENVDQRSAAFHLDSIETGDTGDAILSFESAYRARLLPQTLVTLEQVGDQQDNHIVLILKRGDIKIENFGQEGELFIAKNGERISASDYNSSTLARETTTPVVTSAAATVTAEAPLTEQEISQTMSNHRTSFFKCYTQLLQKDPTAKGDTSLSYTIQNSGKISQSEVTSTTLTTPEFKNCLLEVLRRIEFRTFSGPPISTLFPLKFE